MTSHSREPIAAPAGRGVFFGVPLGELGLLTSLLMALAGAFIAFLLINFLAIFGILIYNCFGHSVDLADSYKFISFPAGCLALVVSYAFFGTLWLRRKFSGK